MHEVEHKLESGKQLHNPPKQKLILDSRYESDETALVAGDDSKSANGDVNQRKHHVLLLKSAAAFGLSPAALVSKTQQRASTAAARTKHRLRAKERPGDAPREAAVRVGAARAAQQVSCSSDGAMVFRPAVQKLL